MKNKKILIVEDEQIIAENLRYILNEYGYNFVDVAMDVTETQNFFEATAYDLVLMDINLGEDSVMDGIDLIKYLTKRYSFHFMYVTANADAKTVEKVKSTEPAGYIVKPFVNASIYANVEIVLNSFNKKETFSFINKGMHQNVPVSEITYVKADGAYIYFYTINKKKHLIRKSLAEFNNLFPTVFIRIHKSILINKHHIQAYTSQSVKINDLKLPLSRTHKQTFLELIKELSFS